MHKQFKRPLVLGLQIFLLGIDTNENYLLY